jgi:hypothetical protein
VFSIGNEYQHSVAACKDFEIGFWMGVRRKEVRARIDANFNKRQGGLAS